MSCMFDRLSHAVTNTCSKEPDSFGDKLFRIKLRWSWLRREQAVTSEFISEVAKLLNCFEEQEHEASLKRTGLTHYSCPVYQVA